MFTTIKQVFQPKNKDLLKRLLFTLFGLIIYKIGTAIVVPGIDRARLGTDNLGFLELINVMGGGALERFSILHSVLCLILQHQLLFNYYKWILFHI